MSPWYWFRKRKVPGLVLVLTYATSWSSGHHNFTAKVKGTNMPPRGSVLIFVVICCMGWNWLPPGFSLVAFKLSTHERTHLAKALCFVRRNVGCKKLNAMWSHALAHGRCETNTCLKTRQKHAHTSTFEAGFLVRDFSSSSSPKVLTYGYQKFAEPCTQCNADSNAYPIKSLCY